MKRIITIRQGVCKMPQWRMAAPVNFSLCAGEHLAIFGPNGSGKSMLVDMVTGRHPLYPGMVEYHFSQPDNASVADNVKYITFRDTYGGDNDRTYFLQQRWNQTEQDEATPTAGEKLEEAFSATGEDTPERRQQQQQLYQLFELQPLLDKRIILLSSGELRKVKIASQLFSSPQVLIIDNPFIGLDAATRQSLSHLLSHLTQTRSIQLILVLSKQNDIPTFITHVVEVSGMKVLPKIPLEDFLSSCVPPPATVLTGKQAEAITSLPQKNASQEYHADTVIRMNSVSIQYGERTILKDLNWTVRNGERWALSGPNGAGKSTLLSLVCADNPQSYACDITLFDRQRGSGETIWDIKRHIGYVSPEMHRSYHRAIPAVNVVASGLNDSIGLYVKMTEQARNTSLFWMNLLGMAAKADTPFTQLSSGEQRLVLLARAFVKDPELLILDEPLHGLDDRNRRLAKDIIETFCSRPNKTLIMVTHYQEDLPDCITHRLTLKKHIATGR